MGIKKEAIIPLLIHAGACSLQRRKPSRMGRFYGPGPSGQDWSREHLDVHRYFAFGMLKFYDLLSCGC